MAISPKQAFKLAFLKSLVDSGLTLDEVKSRVKEAADKTAALTDFVTRPYNAAWDGLAHMGTFAKNMGLLGAIVAPPALGGLAGYGAAKLTDLDDMDADEAKQRELIELYNRHAVQARLNRASKLRRASRQPSFSRI